MRTSPVDSVAVPPYEETSMRSIWTGIVIDRIKSAMKGSEPFRTLTSVSSRPAKSALIRRPSSRTFAWICASLSRISETSASRSGRRVTP